MASRNVVILHYHLRSAGVTRVIQTTVDALNQRGHKAVVMAGEPPAPNMQIDAEVRVVEGLLYNADPETWNPEELAGRIQDEAADALGAKPDLWHIHNHNLGKNFTLPLLVKHLAGTDTPLLLQIHDFAEDGRPGNYAFLREGAEVREADLDKMLYPIGPTVHYALLNSRDRDFLLKAGGKPDCLHLLPNSVTDFDPLPMPDREQTLHIYGTTGIRRKNVGELLLWAACAEDDDAFAITQEPQNPDSVAQYEEWLQFSEKLGLPVTFRFGHDYNSFEDVVSQGQRCVTTSVAEGFGLSFLEPWLMGRPLLGRDIPDITRDFRDSGVCLDALYERLGIPVEWLDMEVVRDKVRNGLTHTRESYDLRMTDEILEAAVDSMLRDGLIEFGKLDEELQQTAIRRVREDKSVRADMRARFTPQGLPDEATISRNREAIAKNYSAERYGDFLENIYNAVTQDTGGTCSHLLSSRILEQFSAPERFCLLRSN